MNNFEWLQSVREVIHDFSDAEFQRQSWIHGESEKVSSFEELVCRLYDDLNFDDLLHSGINQGVLDEKTYTSMSKFSRLLESLDELQMSNGEGHVDAAKLLNSKAWKTIHESAFESVSSIDHRLKLLGNVHTTRGKTSV